METAVSKLLYELGSRMYFLGMRLIAPFHAKAHKWIQERKGLWTDLEQQLSARKPGQCLVWMHCASLGEWEQGRPVLEAIRQKHPDTFLLLSFFSPSGKLHARAKDLVDAVTYLPEDRAGVARRFIRLVKPDLALFVKYEFWYHYLRAVRQAGVPLVLIAAHFQAGQVFFKWYGGIYRAMLQCFDHIFVQDANSLQLLKGIGVKNATLAGDTRMDRVLQVASTVHSDPVFDQLAVKRKLFIAGSTWPADHDLLLDTFSSPDLLDWTLVLVPHELDPKELHRIAQARPDATFYSKMRHQQDIQPNIRLLVVDQMGILAKLYRYSTLAWVGGALGTSGIHSVLEPAAYGIPVLFGPNYHKSREASELLQAGGAFAVSTAGELRRLIDTLYNHERYEEAKHVVTQFLTRNQGATQRVMGELDKKGWLCQIKKPTSSLGSQLI